MNNDGETEEYEDIFHIFSSEEEWNDFISKIRSGHWEVFWEIVGAPTFSGGSRI